ncbi:MAG: sigma-70 family RNA polymerase sigma factor [Xanthomonadales bacterium]|jgi:RNA polymerase sigma-70 factor (ECF subfamily)|nr:sigma-70 family RNA polymerase sigma factor [Xanthomonadales bacterium]
MHEDSDETLMLAYAQGDAKAFEVLYGRYRQSLYGYFLRHVSDEPTANDLYQGCWEKVIRGRKRYRERSPFRAWLFHIAHNHLVDHYRAQRSTAPLPDSLAEESTREPPAQLAEDDRSMAFRAALAELPQEQREALSLRLDAGLSQEEVARVTGVGKETVKSRLRYGIRKLREVLP